MSATLQEQEGKQAAALTANPLVLPPYDPKSHCPKCGYESVGTEFHRAGSGHFTDLLLAQEYHIGCDVLFCAFDGFIAHIVRTCTRCGAAFYQAPLDSVIETVKEEV